MSHKSPVATTNDRNRAVTDLLRRKPDICIPEGGIVAWRSLVGP